jgi:hypothetical protein
MPVGEYNKQNLLVRSLKRKFPYDDIDSFGLSNKILKKPKINYGPSTLDISPSAISAMANLQREKISNEMMKNNPAPDRVSDSGNKVDIKTLNNEDSKDNIENAKLPLDLISKVSIPNSLVNLGNTVAKTFTGVPMGEAPALVKGMGTVGSAVGKGAAVLGGAVSGANLAVTINDIINNGGKVSKDNAFKLADNITGVATAGMNFIPVVGPELALATQVLEKAITGGIKWGMADKEKKKELGVKHLGFSDWAQTGLDSFGVGWMSKDFKDLAKENKQKAIIKKAAKAQEKEEWKHMSKKEKAKRIFFG